MSTETKNNAAPAKVLLLVGAAHGIGRAMALQAAERGLRIAACDIDGAALETLRPLLPPDALLQVMDVTKLDGVQAFVDATLAKFGQIDSVISNAGGMISLVHDGKVNANIRPFQDIPPGDWKSIMDLNLYGTLNVAHAVVPAMVARGKGAIVFVSSVSGLVGGAGLSVYAAAKGGVIAFAKSLARELAAKGVAVNSVAPGGIATRAFPEGSPTIEKRLRNVAIGRLGAPEEIANVAVYLACDAPQYLTGEVISVSGRPSVKALRVAAASPSFCEHPVLCDELLALFPDAKINTGLRRLEGAELIDFLQGHDVAMVGLEYMTEEVIAALPELKIIAKLGTGVDMLDAQAMAARGIRLGWEAGANALSIAELVIALALISLRQVGAAHAALRQQQNYTKRMGRLLSGRVFGLHGCGHIAQAVVRLLKPFGCHILAHDTADRSAFYAEHQIEAVSFEALLQRSEVLSIHVPLTAQTRGLYGAEVLAQLRPDCVLINTARGQIVDEDALYGRLAGGLLSAAAADVFESEPAFDSRLNELPNFFGTPHIGGSAAEARLAMGRIALRGIFENFVPVPGVHPFGSEKELP